MVTFGNLKQSAGVKALNDFLSDRSYIEGYSASQSDVAVFEALGSAPAASFPHALRWYKQLSSYGNDKASLPGVKPSLDSAAPAAAAAPAAPAAAAEDDDDVDLFGSDDDEEADAEAARVREERLAAYAEKKSQKPGPIAKSQILLDVKPWGDDTDMAALEASVRSIVMDGLVWGASELKPLAFGIRKLTILSTVVDDKISVDDLTEAIQAFEDYVQSVDIAAFNKV